MRRIVLPAALLVSVLLAASTAHAQRRIRSFDDQTVATVHVGLSSPTGEFGDFFESGVGFGGSIGYGVSDRVVISLNLSHHDFDSDFAGLDASITPITFNADYAFPTDGSIMPWLGGGIGVYQVDVEDDFFGDAEDSTFGFNLGGGIAGRIARRTLLGGGIRYHLADEGDDVGLETHFFTVQVGLGFLL